MQKNRKLLYTFALLLDLILIVVSFYCVSLITHTTETLFMGDQFVFFLTGIILVWIFSSQSTGLYEGLRGKVFTSDMIRITKNVLIQGGTLIIIIFLLKLSDFPRAFVLMYIALLFLLITSEKFILYRLMIYARMHGRNLRNVLIIGAGKSGMNVYKAYKHNPDLGYNVIGFLDNESRPYLNGEYLGRLSDIEKILNEYSVDNALITLQDFKKEEIDEIIRICKTNSIKVKKIPGYFSSLTENDGLLMVEKFPIITIRGEKPDEIHWRVTKRIMDILFSSLFFVLVAWWQFPLIALIIKITSKGPVIFKQERWGKDNKKFILYKFRTMYEEDKHNDNNLESLRTLRNDPRITPFGKFLRKTSLDETPQFWNILKGEMALVGPRPLPTQLNQESINKLDLHLLRHVVKPGLTGWAQVNGYRGGISMASHLENRLQYDLWYIENWSLWLDLEILFLTAFRTLKGDPDAY